VRRHRIDAAAAGLGAGAGNTPMEVFIAVCDRMGIETGVDLWKIQDVAEDLVVPMMDFPIRIDRDALTLGYAGVYGSFLLFAKRAEKKYGVPARDILVELGRRGMVGGQEDMIEDTAMTMARGRNLRTWCGRCCAKSKPGRLRSSRRPRSGIGRASD
jgi:4-hydroxy-2-oxovalerate/4-hydroxy-2-oxohexanoate aldolase